MSSTVSTFSLTYIIGHSIKPQEPFCGIINAYSDRQPLDSKTPPIIEQMLGEASTDYVNSIKDALKGSVNILANITISHVGGLQFNSTNNDGFKASLETANQPFIVVPLEKARKVGITHLKQKNVSKKQQQAIEQQFKEFMVFDYWAYKMWEHGADDPIHLNVKLTCGKIAISGQPKPIPKEVLAQMRSDFHTTPPHSATKPVPKKAEVSQDISKADVDEPQVKVKEKTSVVSTTAKGEKATSEESEKALDDIIDAAFKELALNPR